MVQTHVWDCSLLEAQKNSTVVQKKVLNVPKMRKEESRGVSLDGSS